MSVDVKKYQSYKRWLLFHLVNQKQIVFLVIAGIIIVTLSRVLVPIIIGTIIDTTLLTRNISKLFVLLFIALVVYLIRNGMDYFTMMFGHYLGLKTEQYMRQEFFDTIQHKSLRYHDIAKTGDLEALATNDLRIINTMLSHGSFYIYPFFQAILAFLMFVTLDERLATVCIPFFVIYIYFVLDYRKKISPWAAARMVKHSNLAVVLQESISGIAVVKAFTSEKLERKKFGETVIGFRDNRIGETRVQAKFYPLLVLYIAIGLIFFIGTILVSQNSLSIGVLTAANLLLISLIDPTNMIFWATNDMMSGFAACSRLFNSLLIEENEISEAKQKKWPKNFTGNIEFRNITFSYGEGKPPVLKNLSFNIKNNQKVALVGPTGCGKTTIVKLLLRLYEPQEGNIYLDGRDIRDFSLNELRKHVGYIEQDIYLFSRTIKENIVFGKPNATDQEILAVAELAQVHDFVKEFPNQYETVVGERGTRLSGGEKQRVAIARAFLTNPDILILDDAVSAVDSETEEKITRSMENIVKNRTTLIITHRLHTIRSSDKILVLKKGQIIAEGNHDELLQYSSDYRRIFGKFQILPPLKIGK